MRPKDKYRAARSWLVVTVLVVLCAVLGYLQYHWIGEVSIAARDRLRAALQGSVARFSRDFNSQVAAACRALLPLTAPPDGPALRAQLATRYEPWKSGQYGRMFDRIAIALPASDGVVLEVFDPEANLFKQANWPGDWAGIRARIESRFRQAAGPEPAAAEQQGFAGQVFEIPVFGSTPNTSAPAVFGRREVGWVILQVNLPYVREVLIPELLQRHLGASESAEYQVAVLTNTAQRSPIYESDPRIGAGITRGADVSVRFFNVQGAQFFQQGARGRGGMQLRGGRRGFTMPPMPPMPPVVDPEMAGPLPGPGRGSGLDFGRWTIFVRYRAGSLEAVVAQARGWNLAVTGGVLLLILASVLALISFTRQAQKLAALQMEFVAGVSHELRTPLTVIHTAGHNLQGKLAANPSQVTRYGALIQAESKKLEDLVEQVLFFARWNAGNAVKKHDPISLEAVIDDSLSSSRTVIEESHCVVDKQIEPDLPLVAGDALALKHALQNLLLNAAKYGAEGGNWIGLTANRVVETSEVEICVADRGPGIPKEEQPQIFEPFFRGKDAMERQIHGTGLGLNLVKKIVEAHGGSISVKSQPMQGTEFIMRLPALPAGAAP